MKRAGDKTLWLMLQNARTHTNCPACDVNVARGNHFLSCGPNWTACLHGTAHFFVFLPLPARKRFHASAFSFCC